MGMFDYVKCDWPLPDGKPTPGDMFQTKDFDEPYMERYTITKEGRLVHHAVRTEMVPEHERPNYGKQGYRDANGKVTLWGLRGSMRAVPIGDVDLNYHGFLNFYGGEGDEWREFNAKFTDGQLVEIKQVLADDEAAPVGWGIA